MNCYLPWNLKDMTNISAEKLQKNISQQASYIQLYRSELTKEAYKFNIGSLLRHICTERASFGNEPIQKRATDCLIIFLHAAAFQKVTYFAPTDAENPAVAKCARNLHRLMLENVKSTMRFIDYEVLQKHARGEIDTAELFPERQRIHNSVFPDEELITLSHNESLNDGFLKLIDMETQKARTFVDFDVQRNSDIPTDLCQKLAKVPRSEASLPESRYGLIGSCRSSLETPFVRYGNSYYSFVTAYSLNAIAPIVDKFAHEMPVVTIQEPEPISEPEAEPETRPEQEEEPKQETTPAEEPIESEEEEEPVEDMEPEADEEPEVEAEPEVVEEPEEAAESEDIEEPVETEETVEEEEEESEQEEPADSPEIAETEEPEESAEPAEDEDDEIPFDEPTETYFEPEVSEASEEEEEDDESDSSELEEFRNDAPVIEESTSEEDQEEENPEDDPFEDDLVEEEDYTALVSPDTYDYLNQTKSSEFAEDPMLEEQDQETCYDDEDEEEDQETSEEDDEPDPYRGESLFSIMDDSDEEEPVQEEPEEEKQEEQEAPIQPQSYPEDEEEPVEEKPLEQEAPQEPEAEPQEESEVREEPEPEAQPEEEHEEEPQPAPVEDQTLPLLDQILRCAPSKNNPIVQYLANCPFEQKKEIIRFIELARKAWLIDGKDKMFTIPDTSISVAVFSETQDPMLNIQRRENIGAVMYASQKDSWNSLEISYDSSGQFVKADYVRISRNSFTDWEWKIVEKLGTRLMERRAK